jgi:hypothetical protein
MKINIHLQQETKNQTLTKMKIIYNRKTRTNYEEDENPFTTQNQEQNYLEDENSSTTENHE